MAESITEGTLSQFSKKVGDFIEADEELATIETDKIDVSVNAPLAGIIQRLFVAEGDVVNVDQEIAEIQAGGKQSTIQNEKEISKPSEKIADLSPKSQDKTASHASLPVLEKPTSKPPGPNPDLAPREEPLTKTEKPAPNTSSVKMTRIRKRTSERLKESQNTAAFLTTFNEVDMSRLIELRKNNKDAIMEKHGVKLGFMGFMARASALALKEIPAVNASIENDDTIVYRDYVDLSIAASIPKGLVTPVVRNIESMGILQIEKAIGEMVKKARDGKLTMDDMTGGSFTISNSGVWGSLFGTPIINLPQTAVLGTYGTMDRPIAVNGQVEIRPMMYVALTYDHRIIDGREAVKFLVLVKKYLESPESMMLEL
ncbi:Dihydrolipoamide succinyltransferase [Penicillium expansum]|nr:Dihydrolipoamide succinyltransferase [Penicillium expansum]